MRIVYISIAVALFGSAPAFAQEAPAECQTSAPVERVVLTMHAGNTIRGTLLCLSSAEALVLRDGQSIATPIAMVRKIETRADSPWDGGVKGAAIPLVFWAIFCHDCEAAPLLKTMAAYGLVGLTLDSLQRNTTTIYSGRRRALVGWRVQF